MRALTLGIAAAGIAAIVASEAADLSTKIIYNTSSSAPVGWYVVQPDAPLRRGDHAPIWLPAEARKLANERGYLPSYAPLLKQVFALWPDEICIRDQLVFANEIPVAALQTSDKSGRPLTQIDLCRRLNPGELFLLNPLRTDSFDSRYFGPVGSENVIGKAVPIWVQGGS